MTKKGWFKEPARHALASMGVKSPKKSINAKVKRVKYKKVAKLPSKNKFVTMRCGVCGADCYSDGTKDCECDAYDYGRMASGESHYRYINTRDDLTVYVDELMGQNATESTVRVVVDALVRDARAPVWGDDWSKFIDSVDLWKIAAELDNQGMIPSKSVTSSEVRKIVSDARFDVNPYARTYIDALSDSEAMYGEHGVEVQAAYIATNLRAKTPEQKEAKKLLQRIADGKYKGKKVTR